MDIYRVELLGTLPSELLEQFIFRYVQLRQEVHYALVKTFSTTFGRVAVVVGESSISILGLRSSIKNSSAAWGNVSKSTSTLAMACKRRLLLVLRAFAASVLVRVHLVLVLVVVFLRFTKQLREPRPTRPA